MLTQIEWSQIKTAIKCMDGFNLNESFHISQNNILVLISTYVEEQKTIAADEIKEIKR